jgi:hypothetical protein
LKIEVEPHPCQHETGRKQNGNGVCPQGRQGFATTAVSCGAYNGQGDHLKKWRRIEVAARPICRTANSRPDRMNNEMSKHPMILARAWIHFMIFDF